MPRRGLSGRWSPPPRPLVALTTVQGWLATAAATVSSGIEALLALDPVQVVALGLTGTLAALEHVDLGDPALQRAASARLLAALAIASRAAHAPSGPIGAAVLAVLGPAFITRASGECSAEAEVAEAPDEVPVPVDRLPDELLLHVLSLLPTPDIYRSAALVSRRWRRLALDRGIRQAPSRQSGIALFRRFRRFSDDYPDALPPIRFPLDHPDTPVGDALGHPLSLTLASRSPDWAPQGWTLVYTGWSDGSIHLHRFQTGTDPADPDSKTFVRKVVHAGVLRRRHRGPVKAVVALPHANIVLSGGSQFYRCIMINPVLFNRDDPAQPPVIYPEPIMHPMPMAVFDLVIADDATSRMFVALGDATVLVIAADNAEGQSGQPIPRQAVYSGHTAAVHVLAFCKATDMLYTGSTDRTVRGWNTREGRGACSSRDVLRHHYDRVRALAVTSDGETLVSGSDDGNICVWSTGLSTATVRTNYAQSAYRMRTVEAHSAAVVSLAMWQPGGHPISAGSDGAVVLWDTGCTARLLQLPPGPKFRLGDGDGDLDATMAYARQKSVGVGGLAVTSTGLLLSLGESGDILLHGATPKPDHIP